MRPNVLPFAAAVPPVAHGARGARGTRPVLLGAGVALALALGGVVGTADAHTHGIEILLATGVAVAVLLPAIMRGWRGRFDPFEPLLTVSGVYLVYFVIGPLLRLVTDDTVVIGRDMRTFYAPAFAAVLAGVCAMWFGYHLPLGAIVGRQLTRVRGGEQSSPTALRRLRWIGWGLTVAAMGALVLWSRLEGQSLARFFLPGVIAPAEKTGGGTNLAYLFLAIEWFIPAFLILSASGGFRTRPVQWAYFAFVSIAYTSLGFRYRLIILWVATFMLAYLRRGRRPRASTLLAGAGVLLLFAGWLGIARGVFKSSARGATAAPTFVEVARNSLSDTEVFETFGAVLDAVPGRVEFAGADPYVYVLVQPIPRALWPEKPLPTFLEKIAQAIGTRAAGSAGAAVPHFGEYYLAFGWPGLLLGMAAFGVAVRTLWAWYLADARNAWRQVVFSVSNAFLVQVIIRGYSPQIVQEWVFIIGPAALGMWLAHRGRSPTVVIAGRFGAPPGMRPSAEWARAGLPALPLYVPPRGEHRERRPIASPRRSLVVAVGPLPPPVSGGTVAFREVCDHLERCGMPHRVVNVSPPQSVHVSGARVAAGRVRAWLGALQTIDAALATDGSHEPPTLYLLLGQARGSFLRDLLCVAVARRRGARIVGHVHGGSYDLLFAELGPTLRRALRAMVRRMDAVIVLGEGLRAMFDFEPAAAARLCVVPNALPTDGWTAPEPRTRMPDATLRLLFLSSLIETKGYLELVRAAALLRARGVRVHVDLAGEFRQSPDDEQVRSAEHARALLDETVGALGMQDAVTVHGTVEGAAKRALLAQCDLFVLPTRYRFEGQPIALIEALAAGLPVVSTRYRAIPDVVTDGESGRLIDVSTPEAIADAVAELAVPDVYHRASRAALNRARDAFTPSRFLDRMRDVLGGAAPNVAPQIAPSVAPTPRHRAVA